MLGLLRPEAEGLPESLTALTELRNVFPDPLDEVAEEDGGIPIIRVERVPDGALTGLFEEARQERCLAIPRTGHDDGGAPLKRCGQSVHEARARQVERSDLRWQELDRGQRRGARHGRACASASRDHSSSLA